MYFPSPGRPTPLLVGLLLLLLHGALLCTAGSVSQSLFTSSSSYLALRVWTRDAPSEPAFWNIPSSCSAAAGCPNGTYCLFDSDTVLYIGCRPCWRACLDCRCGRLVERGQRARVEGGWVGWCEGCWACCFPMTWVLFIILFNCVRIITSLVHFLS